MSFLLVGDWGGEPYAPFTNTHMTDVAAAMAKTATALPSGWPSISTIHSSGDNFYNGTSKKAF